MALPLIGGPLNGQSVPYETPLTQQGSDSLSLVWCECVAEDEPVLPLDTPMPVRFSYSVVKHCCIMKCRGEYVLSNCWLEHVGVVP